MRFVGIIQDFLDGSHTASCAGHPRCKDMSAHDDFLATATGAPHRTSIWRRLTASDSPMHCCPLRLPQDKSFFIFMILHVYWVSFIFNCDDFSPVIHRFLIRDHTVEHGRCSNGGPFALPATVIRRMPGRLADQWHGQVKIVSGWHEIGSRFTNTKTHI